jgi:hypothetical protein
VILAARNPERLKQAASEVDALSPAAFDASDPGAIERFFHDLPTIVAALWPELCKAMVSVSCQMARLTQTPHPIATNFRVSMRIGPLKETLGTTCPKKLRGLLPKP